ncbi:MAG: MoaD/ThiS family protein [Nitrososphaerota archaeon]
MIIQLYGHLRTEASKNVHEVKIGGRRRLKEVLELLPEPVRRQVLDDSGSIRPGYLILVNDVDARTVYNYEVEVSDSDRIVIVPMIHGGNY